VLCFQLLANLGFDILAVCEKVSFLCFMMNHSAIALALEKLAEYKVGGWNHG
jgi:hypothetical protein